MMRIISAPHAWPLYGRRGFGLVAIGASLALSGCVLVAGPGARAAVVPPLPSATSVDRDAARTQIVAMMAASAGAWNAGDLNAFMSYYVPGDAPTFVGRSGILHGRDAIRSVYAARFAPGGVRDSLSFEDVNVDLLAPDVASVIAYYRLMRGDSTTARGPTSLVMRHSASGWRILHDHSS